MTDIPASPMLVAEHISRRFGSYQALEDISFEIPRGSVFGIIGPNGAGKTTLLKVITSLILPDSGSITIDGIDVESNPRRALRNIGAIIDWPSFYRDMTARENIDILSRGSGPEYRAKLEKIAEFNGIAHVLDKKVRDFSMGMKQRLGITLALLPDSRFIILDEPTNGLDPNGIADIRRLISEYNREFGTTILVTSHLLEEVEKICSDILLLSDGRVRLNGKLEKLLERRPSCLVSCDRPQEAARFIASLTGLPGVETLLEPDGRILVSTDRHVNAELNEALVGAGFHVTLLENEPNRLEKLFIETTGAGKAVKSC